MSLCFFRRIGLRGQSEPTRHADLGPDLRDGEEQGSLHTRASLGASPDLPQETEQNVRIMHLHVLTGLERY